MSASLVETCTGTAGRDLFAAGGLAFRFRAHESTKIAGRRTKLPAGRDDCGGRSTQGLKISANKKNMINVEYD